MNFGIKLLKSITFIFTLLIFAGCGSYNPPEPAVDYYTPPVESIINTHEAPELEHTDYYYAPPITSAPLPSLKERVVPIGYTFTAIGDDILVIKEDATLWRYNENYDPLFILDNAVSVWVIWTDGSVMVHRTDGSLWRWERRYDSTPFLFLEGVAYFDGRLSVLKLDGSLWRWSWDNIPMHVMDDVISFSTWLAASSFYMIITRDNRLWGWDADMWHWAVMDDNRDEYQYKPALLMENIAYVSTARFHAAAICFYGYLWEFIDWTYTWNVEPVKIMNNVTTVCAETFSGANPLDTILTIRSDGSLWGWGWGFNRDIGIQFTYTPTLLWHDTAQIIRGWRTVWVITQNGELWDISHEPIMILENIAAASTYPGMALDFYGNLWAWETDIAINDVQYPFGTFNEPRHMPAIIITGVLLCRDYRKFSF